MMVSNFAEKMLFNDLKHECTAVSPEAEDDQNLMSTESFVQSHSNSNENDQCDTKL